MVNSTSVIQFGTPCGKDIENYLEERGKWSKNTAASYRGDFSRFLKSVFNTTIEHVTTEQLNNVDYDLLMRYRHDMDGILVNNTINRHISTISAILKHLKSRNVLKSDVSYLDDIRKLPIQPVEIAYMPPEVVDRYISEAGKDTNYPELKQNLIMIAVEGALRLNEALELEIGQFTVIDEETVVLKGYGKGNKEYFDKIDISIYNKLVKAMKTDKNNPKSKIFKPLNTKNITDMMTRIRKQLKYDDMNYSFHSFKKTGVTAAYIASGNDILEAQRKGRHESLDTTRRYLKGEDYGVTGLFSLRERDSEVYKKVSHEELLKGIEGMSEGFLNLLNTKINSLKEK